MPQLLSQSMISIIIPTLNEEENIAPLLERLLGLTAAEIIVVDGGSCDSTLDICRQFPVKLLKSPRGRGIQLNTGAGAAQGEILLFLHADSLIEERVLDDIRSATAEGCNWGCCSLMFNERNRIFRTIACLSNLRSGIFSSCYGDQAIFCKRDLFQKSGGFPDSVFLEDLEFSHKMRRQQKARVIKGKVITSTRRYRTAGLWKTIAKIQMVKILYTIGVMPEQLRKWYG